jgi:uncharacterized protein
MRVVLDTNVFISGVFFSEPPYAILQAWRDDALKLIISPEIFQEYQRVSEELSTQFPQIDLFEMLDLMSTKGEMIDAGTLPDQISADADDDKFLACAVAGSVGYIVSGDKHLLDVAKYRNVTVVKPRQFVDKYLDFDQSSSAE